MSKAGRTKWADADYNCSADTLEYLVQCGFGEGPKGLYQFQIAERLEKSGALKLGMKVSAFHAVLAEARS